MIKVKGMRVAVDKREGDKDWEGTGRYLSLRKYRENGQLNQGADIPITSKMPDEEIERIWSHLILMTCGEEDDDAVVAA
jgi:hypothetical protein